jgi:NADH-quinone oxidoreductase subunit I
LTPHFEFSQVDVLTLVAEKEDLLVNHGGKNNEYNFYRQAGVAIAGGKGEHINEARPVELRSNLP